MSKRKIVVLNVFIGIIVGLLVMPSILFTIWVMGAVESGAAFFWFLMLQLALEASLGILVLAAIKGAKGKLSFQILAFFASLIVIAPMPLVLYFSIMLLTDLSELVIYIIPILLIAALIILIKKQRQLVLLLEGEKLYESIEDDL